MSNVLKKRGAGVYYDDDDVGVECVDDDGDDEGDGGFGVIIMLITNLI